MLSRSRRISRKIFPKNFSHGSIRTDLFLVRVAPGLLGKRSQVSCVVSKKTARSAVMRNRLRRRVYSAIDKTLNQTKPGYRIVFFLNQKSSQISFDKLVAEINDAFKKLGLING